MRCGETAEEAWDWPQASAGGEEEMIVSWLVKVDVKLEFDSTLEFEFELLRRITACLERGPLRRKRLE